MNICLGGLFQKANAVYLGREAEPLKSGCPVKDQMGQSDDLQRNDQVGLYQRDFSP